MQDVDQSGGLPADYDDDDDCHYFVCMFFRLSK